MTPSAPGAIGRHLALIGFMGAGKTTIGREVARLTERPFVDVDDEIVARHGSIADLFRDGEPGFRRIEEEITGEVLARTKPAVVALGGGALGSQATRERLRERAFTVLVDVDVETAWRRVGRSDRPLAQREETFRRLYEERRPVYETAGDAVARTSEDVLLAALLVVVEPGSLRRLRDYVPGTGPVALVADRTVFELHPIPELDPRLAEVHVVRSGEQAKSADQLALLWDELAIERGGLMVAFGGGATTDLVGFAAATYLRGVPWVAVPTTLLAQVDAAIGGKTGINTRSGKNLVGAFWFPARVVADPDVLATLPVEERRYGMAEVVKLGLLAGRPLWELPDAEMVRACAAFKSAIVVSDPHDGGRRAILNLGHTFAHALEAASGYTVPHGDAVALGLLAALRLSGQPTDVVEELLDPQPVPVDRDRAWAALKRDKKAASGRTRLVVLRAPGEPEYGVELPDADVRRALDELVRE